MSHREKKRLARKLRTPEEEKNGVELFQSKAWEERKKLKRLRHEKKNSKKEVLS